MNLEGSIGTLIDPFEALFQKKFPFYVVNRSFPDSAGNYEKLDLIVDDRNHNGKFDLLYDIIRNMIILLFIFASNTKNKLT